MNKEELEKEAFEYAEREQCAHCGNPERCPGKEDCYDLANIKQYYLAGAEPREKRIAELEAEVKEWKDKADLWCKTANLKDHNIMINKELEKENAELRKITEFQQSSNMNRHFENKKLKEGLAVGSILNKGLNSLNKALEEERDKYRNMVFDKDEQLTKAKKLIERLLTTPRTIYGKDEDGEPSSFFNLAYEEIKQQAEQFLQECK